ncbi:MAG: hypothetical protein ACLFTR_03635 [Candidatus Woesearchaeota archaeon]
MQANVRSNPEVTYLMLQMIPVLLAVLFMTGCTTSLEIAESKNTSIYDRTPGDPDLPIDQIPRRETGERFIHTIHADDIGNENLVTKVLSVGEIVDIYEKGSVAAKLQLTEVISGREVKFSQNNRKSERYREDEMINLFDKVYVEIEDIFFHENKNTSGVIISFSRRTSEKYPDRLIENRIGLNQYISSHKIDNSTFEARYEYATVTVREGEKFAKHYPDSSNLIDFDDRMLYKIPNSSKIAWVSYRAGKEYVIEIEDFTETIIREYFWDYPSFLNRRTLCKRRLDIPEESSRTEWFEEEKIDVKVDDISVNNFEVNISIGEEGSVKLAPGENVIYKDIVIILDGISLDEGKEARICLA